MSKVRSRDGKWERTPPYSRLEKIITHGNVTMRGFMLNSEPGEDNWIQCADGFKMSVIAGMAYSTPKLSLCFPGTNHPHQQQGHAPCNYKGPYVAVEVGFPTIRPEPWGLWCVYADGDFEYPTKTVYGYVPVKMVRDLVRLHGGEVPYHSGSGDKRER